MYTAFRLFLPLSLSILWVTCVGCGGSSSQSTTTPPTNPPTDTCTPPAAPTSTATCPTRTPVAGVAFTGKVLAGQQPVSGASVQLLAAGIAGNGSAPTQLTVTAVKTDASGSFAIQGGYACPSAQTPVYLLSKGGVPGSGSANSSSWLMTALGSCGSITAAGSYVVNEATTAASVWALSPFMSSGGNVGSSCTNVAGLVNAFQTANGLVDPSKGTAPGVQALSTVILPTSKLNTLANALNSCSSSSGGSSCASLMNAAISGSSTPTNTVDAALNISRAPGANVAAIYALAAGKSAYSPSLAAAPPDWTLSSVISGGGMWSPATVGVADSGNVWVASYFGALSEFTSTGAPVFPSGIVDYNINQTFGLTFDPNGNIWIANEQTEFNSGTGNAAVLNSSGQFVATGLTGGGLNYPVSAVADTTGNVWFTNYGNSTVTLLSNSGTALSPSTGWAATSLSFPVALAVDFSHNAWVANQGGKVPITRISPDGSQIKTFDCDCEGASGIAIDRNSDVWVANFYGNSISEVNSCGTLVLDAAKGGGILRPQGIAIDGAGTVWVANFQGNSLSVLSGSSSTTPGTFLSPATGFGTDAPLSKPYSVAVDGSGNVWVSNSGNDTLSKFIGLATPVKTPMIGPPQIP
jgi:Streptogramin lyase